MSLQHAQTQINPNTQFWCRPSRVDWVASCCRQLHAWLFMSWKMKRAAREMTSASRTHRSDSLLLLSALFTLHTWAGIQINLQCCHKTLNTRDKYFISPAARWGAYARSKISGSPETFPVCAHVERARVALLVPAAKKVGSAVVGRSRKKNKGAGDVPPSICLLASDN